MAGVVAISIFNPFRALMKQLPVDMDNLVVSGSKITMESPHMSGFTPDQRPYEVWAKTATQDLTDPDRVELKTLRAKVLQEDRSTVTLEARTGLFDTKAQLLDLRKDIFLQSSTGYEARLSQALLDIGKGTVTSEEPVDVKLLNGTLTADKLRITEKGALVRFEGHVVMNLIMDNPDPASAEPANRSRAVSGRAHQSAAVIGQARQREMKSAMMFFATLTPVRRLARGINAGLIALATMAAGDAGAQSAVKGVPNAMQGFSQNRDQPIQIEAASLEMRDKKKEATFAGNVKVVQGDTTMTSKSLVVFYDQSAAPAPAAAGSKGTNRRPDPVGNPGARRQFVDPPARGQGQRRRDPEGSDRDRRDRDLRHQGQPGHDAGRRGSDPRPERAARRPAGGGHDHRRVAHGIRYRARAGPVPVVGPGWPPGNPRHVRIRRHAGSGARAASEAAQREMNFMMARVHRSFRSGRIVLGVNTVVFALGMMAAGDARAQNAAKSVPNAMQGFSQNRDQPIQIEAASLEMRDKKKEATFAGNVKVVQGDTTMTSKSLVVFLQFRPGAGHAAARRRQRIEIRLDASRRSRTPAAVPRSAGSRPRAPSSSPRRTRS